MELNSYFCQRAMIGWVCAILCLIAGVVNIADGEFKTAVLTVGFIAGLGYALDCVLFNCLTLKARTEYDNYNQHKD